MCGRIVTSYICFWMSITLPILKTFTWNKNHWLTMDKSRKMSELVLILHLWDFHHVKKDQLYLPHQIVQKYFWSIHSFCLLEIEKKIKKWFEMIWNDFAKSSENPNQITITSRGWYPNQITITITIGQIKSQSQSFYPHKVIQSWLNQNHDWLVPGLGLIEACR